MHKKKITYVLLFIILFILYMIVTPMYLWMNAPYPEAEDIAKVQMLKDNFSKYIKRSLSGKNKIRNDIIMHDNVVVVVLPENLKIINKRYLLAYAAQPEKPVDLPFYWCFSIINIRGWPNESIPARRMVLYTNQEVKIVEECSFDDFLKIEKEKIRKLWKERGHSF